MENIAAPKVNLDNLLGMAKTAELAKNNAEATQYYNRVLEIDPTVWEAWIGKGRAAGWQSTLAEPRVNEMMVAFANAIGCAGAEEQQTVAHLAATVATHVILEIYGMAEQHNADHGNAVPAARATYLSVSEGLLAALKTVSEWRPEFRPTLELEVRIARDLLNLGVAEPWKTTIREHMDRANAEIEDIDPDYKRPALAAQTTVQREKAKQDSDNLGYIVAFIIAVLGAIITAASRG